MAAGTMTNKLSVNLTVNVNPSPLWRFKLVLPLLALIVRFSGARLTIGVEPQFSIGTIEPQN